MALIHSLEKNGNFLFKYRGQFPVILFLLAIPIIYTTDYSWLNDEYQNILLIICIMISALGQMVRSISIGTAAKHTSGRNTREQVAEALNTTGIYSTIRHPLYLGNYLMWIGIVAFTFNIWFIVIASLLYWIYYERIMFAEERFLEGKFGKMYMDWSKTVPAFWPSFKNYVKPKYTFSMMTNLRREYSGFSATILSFLFVEILRNSFISHEFIWNDTYTVITGMAIAISLIFRTLKKYTNIIKGNPKLKE